MLGFVFKPAVYIPLSYLALILYSLDNILLYQELFAVTIALSNSAIFIFLVWAVVLSSVQLYWIVLRTIFFGSLNTPEREVVSNALKERCIPFGLYLIITRSAHLQPFLVLTFATLVMHLLHKLAEERLVTISALVNERWTKFQLYTRLVLFVMFAVIVDYLGLMFLWNMSPTLLKFDYSLDLFYHITMLLFIEHSFGITNCIVKIAFDHFYSEYENLNLVYVIDTTLLLTCNLVSLIYIIWLTITGPARVYLFYPFIMNIENFASRSKQLWRFARLMRVISQFPLASEEALLREQRCIICYEEMFVEQRCRELACGHCYHEICLQKWFRQQYTCPYCRADQLRNRPVTSTTQHAPPQSNNLRNSNDVDNNNNTGNESNNSANNSSTSTTNNDEGHEMDTVTSHNDTELEGNITKDELDDKNNNSRNDTINKVDCNVSDGDNPNTINNTNKNTKTNTAYETTSSAKNDEVDRKLYAALELEKEKRTMYKIVKLEFTPETNAPTTFSTFAAQHFTDECQPDEKEIRETYEWLKTTKCNFWSLNNNNYQEDNNNNNNSKVIQNSVSDNECIAQHKPDFASPQFSLHCQPEHKLHHVINSNKLNVKQDDDIDINSNNCKYHRINNDTTTNISSASDNVGVIKENEQTNYFHFEESRLPVIRRLTEPSSFSDDACTSVPIVNSNACAKGSVVSNNISNNKNFIDDPDISNKDKLVYALRKYERQVAEAQQELDSSVLAIRQIYPKKKL